MNVEKQNDILKAVVIIVIALFVIGASFVYVLGMTSDPASESIKPYIPNEPDPYVPDEPDPYVPPATQYDDSEYIEWNRGGLDDITYYTNKVSDELDSYSVSWYLIGLYSGYAIDEIEDQQSDINDFILSYDFDKIRDEYDDYLSDVYYSYYYLEKASDCMTDYPVDYDGAVDYIDLAKSYTKKATAHLNECTRLTKNIIDDMS